MSTFPSDAPAAAPRAPLPLMPRAGERRRTTLACDVFTRLAPAVMIAVVAPRALRVPGVHEAVGAVLAALYALALAWLARDLWRGRPSASRQLLAAGGLLFALPFALMLLLWVGLATPWDATRPENQMRFLVLATGSVAMAVGFQAIAQALRDAGERVWSTLAGTTALLAGAAYLVWTSFQAGFRVVLVNGGHLNDAFPPLSDVLDTLEFLACATTYAATLLLVVALARQGWLGRRAAWAYLFFGLLALGLLLMRGVAYPDPTADGTPWWAKPGFVAGIPAVPWILPYLLGLGLLRRGVEGPARA